MCRIGAAGKTPDRYCSLIVATLTLQLPQFMHAMVGCCSPCPHWAVHCREDGVVHEVSCLRPLHILKHGVVTLL